MRKSKAKKRIVSAALALSAFFALPLSACGKKDDENGGNVTPSEEIKAEDVEYMAASSAPDYPAISEENEAKYVTYYFAADGNDEAAGTSGNAPLKSVAKANEIIANYCSRDIPQRKKRRLWWACTQKPKKIGARFSQAKRPPFPKS